jgi:hypothetical protein
VDGWMDSRRSAVLDLGKTPRECSITAQTNMELQRQYFVRWYHLRKRPAEYQRVIIRVVPPIET